MVGGGNAWLMPLFNYLTHHLGSFGSIYDSTLINGFASRMGRAAYGDLIVEIPINHGTRIVYCTETTVCGPPFKYKLILGIRGGCTGGTRRCPVASTIRCVGVFVPASQLQHRVCICTGRVKQEAGSNLRQRYTICAFHVLCIRKLATTVYTRYNLCSCVPFDWLIHIYTIYIHALAIRLCYRFLSRNESSLRGDDFVNDTIRYSCSFV